MSKRGRANQPLSVRIPGAFHPNSEIPNIESYLRTFCMIKVIPHPKQNKNKTCFLVRQHKFPNQVLTLVHTWGVFSRRLETKWPFGPTGGCKSRRALLRGFASSALGLGNSPRRPGKWNNTGPLPPPPPLELAVIPQTEAGCCAVRY